MAKISKQLPKDMKKISKQINSEKGLMLRYFFDAGASLYGHGKEKKPYVSIRAKGDYKIPVVKLLVFLACAASTAVLIGLLIKSIRAYSRRPVKATEMTEFAEE